MKQILKLITFTAFALVPAFTFSQYNESKESMVIETNRLTDRKVNIRYTISAEAHNAHQAESPIYNKVEDLPKFSFSQDLYQLHVNFEKAAAKFSSVDFVLYLDIDNDNKMIVNEPAIRFSWNRNDEQFSVRIYNYIPATKNGDVLAEHKDMPGKLVYRKSLDDLSNANSDGEVIDVSIPFMHLTRVTGIVILDQLQFNEKFKFYLAFAHKMFDDTNTILSHDNFRKNISPISKITSSIILYNFTVTQNNYKNYLEWTIGENEVAERFEVQRSTDGKKFATAALVFTSEKEGNEIYKFHEPSIKEKVFYRLKMFDKNLKTEYSQILALKK